VAAALLYLFLCLVWGSTWLVIRIGLADLTPFWSLAIRIGPALLFILILAWVQRTSWAEIKANRRKLLVLSLLVYPVGYGLVYWGEQYVTSGLAAVAFSAMPFFVALLALRLLPGERLTAPKAAGLVMGLAGLVTVYWDQLGLGGPLRLLGMGAITFSAFVSAYTTILIRRDLGRVPPVAMTACTLMMGMLIVPGYALALEGTTTFHLTGRALASAAYLSVVASGLAFVAYYHLLTKISALTMSLISFVTPIVALALAAVYDREVLGARGYIGIALVLAGVLLAARGGHK
jgi:drug/metabolite transporter (DMT)-like permease